MTLQTYLHANWPDLTDARPQLTQAAKAIGDWWDNGRTGDVLNVSMPTRFGKSLTATAFSAWLLLHNPSIRILRASYSADLAESLGLQVRDQYCRWFEGCGWQPPRIDGTRARWRIAPNVLDNHASIGITGGITGFGFDIAIVDDTAKNMLEATSAAYSRTLTSFKESVLLGRLEGRRKILNVGTRWTVNDWFSMWPDAQSYVLPAMVDGHSVCEAWKTTSELELERSRVSEEVWNAQYMQQPTATGRVRLFEGWRPIRAAEVPQGRHVLVMDPATDYGSDYFVVGDYIYSDGLLYLCAMFAKQAATLEEVAAWTTARDYSVAWCESNGAGANIISKLRQKGVRSLAAFVTSKDKYSRAYAQREDIMGRLRVCASVAPDTLAELEREADAFPVSDGSIHDDLLDNVVMAFERIIP